MELKKKKNLNGFTFTEKEILNWIPPGEKDKNNTSSSDEDEEEANDGNEFTTEKLNKMTYEEVR